MDWLVIDTPSVVWRHFHGGARQDAVAAVMYAGNEVARLRDEFGTDRVVWCFDRPVYHRAAYWSGYKLGRAPSKLTDREAFRRADCRLEIDRMWRRTLVEWGYDAAAHAPGFEADDALAAVSAAVTAAGGRSVLVTSDRDSYQLLSRSVAVRHPGKDGRFVTARSFKAEFGIPPRLWAEVKCVAGCASDGVPGLDGVGEATAVKFFRGGLRGTPAHDRILEFNRHPDYARNRQLVALPWPGFPPVALPDTPARRDPDAPRRWADGRRDHDTGYSDDS